LDIEDAIELHLLPDETLKTQFRDLLGSKLDIEQRRLIDDSSVSWRIKNGLLRGKMIGRMIEEVFDVFTDHYDAIMEGRFESDLRSKTDGNSVCLALKSAYEQDKLAKKIYQNHRNIPLELGAYSVLNILLTASAEAAYEIVRGKRRSYKTEIILRFMKQDAEAYYQGKPLHEVIMLFLDYVTGMTDEYATSVNRQLLGLGN
jgi:dGTPase